MKTEPGRGSEAVTGKTLPRQRSFADVVRRLVWLGAAVALVMLVAGLAAGKHSLAKRSTVALTVCVAFGIRFVPLLRGYQFTAWIAAAFTSAMIYPAAFLQWGDFDLRNKWLILIVVQLVMFGMGTQMGLKDFAGVVKAPRGVLAGILCHFSVMPLVGFGLTKIFAFPDEIAAGIILIGSCSSGLASNVMAYLAKSNLVLSVTVTAITTMIAPLMTPLLMKLLAHKLVEVRFVTMMMEIIKIVLVPIGAALLHDYLKHANRLGRKIVWTTAYIGAVWLMLLLCGGWEMASNHLPAREVMWISISGFLSAALIAGLVYNWLTRHLSWLERRTPAISMAGIVYFTTVTTAAGRENLLKVGALLFVASVLHNAAGYGFGYWLSRAFGLDKNSARSVAFEVGLQNGGMASGIAGSLGKLGTMGLAAAIFSPWMNISGSILANYWKNRPVDQPAAKTES